MQFMDIIEETELLPDFVVAGKGRRHIRVAEGEVPLGIHATIEAEYNLQYI